MHLEWRAGKPIRITIQNDLIKYFILPAAVAQRPSHYLTCNGPEYDPQQARYFKFLPGTGIRRNGDSCATVYCCEYICPVESDSPVGWGRLTWRPT